jgi:hypothetical protein
MSNDCRTWEFAFARRNVLITGAYERVNDVKKSTTAPTRFVDPRITKLAVISVLLIRVG